MQTISGESKVQNNRELLLRTIAGFLVHPNTGSALIVSTGENCIEGKREEWKNIRHTQLRQKLTQRLDSLAGQERHLKLDDLKAFMSDYPTEHVPSTPRLTEFPPRPGHGSR